MRLSFRVFCLSSALAAMMSLAGAAHAEDISVTVWNNQPAYPAVLSSTVPSGPSFATFTASSFDFDVPSGGDGTIQGFVNSGSGTGLTCTGGGTACTSATNLNDTYEFLGETYLVGGQTYSFTHDDGMYLFLNGSMYINAGTPTTAITNTFSVTTSGTYDFEVLYTNVNALPSVLQSDISATPEPGSLALLGSGLLGLAGVARRKIFSRS
ncbi:MAG TPA: PEP-CTERM sorting domain-containing protein [Acidobacteriaceae bacterium]|jgi:hypothetical protein|nr:PEP-CTERM sorting domain-containing protein [Acidobacteriaceae bacterium]